MAPNGLRASAIVQNGLVDLFRGISHITNNALHPITFTGALRPWPNFHQDVETAYLNFLRIPRVIDRQQASGRFEQTAGQHVNWVISAVFLSKIIDVQIGEFRATTSRYSKVPGMAGASPVIGALRFVGKLKVPWVGKHDLSEAMGDEDIFRHILGGSGWVLQC
ncbi:hypothetical protein BDV33DRAFT_186469 [Aspergillus novoparasiticus]|uniref:Uncharacterized protein n=1 Tax=Aspergillus novoparasiticus TaxID=986946 RepID=A0A5N6FCH6_9EURO|nr:hypothetical protein BDV33DRAFT_186469 [Aspergillus novoparasiticus]